MKEQDAALLAKLENIVVNEFRSNIELQHEVMAKLKLFQNYLFFLERWMNRVDLVSPANSEMLFIRHFIDCIKGLSVAREFFSEEKNAAILDVGSGAGFPGMVWATMDPSREIILLEPRENRASFLKEIRRELCLPNVDVVRSKISDFSLQDHKKIGFITARALGRESVFLSECAHILNEGSYVGVFAGPNWRQPDSLILNDICGHKIKYVENKPYRLETLGASMSICFWKCFT